MHISPIKTPIIHPHDNLLEHIGSAILDLKEKSVVVVTSKVVALCEGLVMPKVAGNREEKQALAQQEAEWYTDPSSSRYGLILTIKDQVLAVNGGVDESNVDNQYVLLPSNAYASAQIVWEFLRKTYGVQEVGVIVSDSRTIPLKWGVIGTCLGHCGFSALNNHIGQPDLFGYEMQMTQVNVAEALAVAGVLCMGETNESQPLAVITEVEALVQFQDRPVTEQEKQSLAIAIEDDAYAPLLTAAQWHRGGKHTPHNSNQG